jgi:hypothetical protein
MLVVVVTQVFPAARGMECQSCKRKPHEGNNVAYLYIVRLLSIYRYTTNVTQCAKLQFPTDRSNSFGLLAGTRNCRRLEEYFVLAVHVPQTGSGFQLRPASAWEL